MNESWSANVYLSRHPTARNRCVARCKITAGSTIFKDEALAAVLLPSEKGKRCDACFRNRKSTLKRCSGCAEYWYCGSNCQTTHWKTVHRYMCKKLPKYRASMDFQTSLPHKQIDGLLLSHLLAECRDRLHEEHNFDKNDEDGYYQDPFTTFKSLLPLLSESGDDLPPVIFPSNEKIDRNALKELYRRFRNNNFLVHSHLNGIAHGIFPLASRLLNHSCFPNAVVTYSLNTDRLAMSVRALSDIEPEDEIVIPYFDPALPYSSRKAICEMEYGFECTCKNCTFFKAIGNIPSPPEDSAEKERLEKLLLEPVFPDFQNICPPEDAMLLDLPKELYPLLHEDYLPSISGAFTNASHDKQYKIALRNGIILLALYFVIYPTRYPQIGMHCLEIAKTAWNASIFEEEGGNREADIRSAVRRFLDLAKDSLITLESEGDVEDGPWVEYKQLDQLLGS